MWGACHGLRSRGSKAKLISLEPLLLEVVEAVPDEVWSEEAWQQWYAKRRRYWPTHPASPECLLRRLMLSEDSGAKKARFVDPVDSSAEDASGDPAPGYFDAGGDAGCNSQ